MTKPFEDLNCLIQSWIKSSNKSNGIGNVLDFQNVILKIYKLLLHHDSQIYLMENNITELKNNIKSNDQEGTEMENNLREQIARAAHEGNKIKEKRNNKKKIKKLKRRVSYLENRVSHLEEEILKLKTKSIFH